MKATSSPAAATAPSLVSEVASLGLSHTSPPLSSPSVPLPGDRWDGLLREVSGQRLIGLLHTAVAAGHLCASSPQATQLAAAHAQDRAQVLLLDSELLRALVALRNHKVAVLVLKGAAHAALLYDEPTLRSYGDIDLLVEPTLVPVAIDALATIGYRPVHPGGPAAHGTGSRYRQGLGLRGPQGVLIDLHGRLTEPPFGVRIEPRDLFATAQHVSIRGVDAAALAPEERFLHCCLHAVLEGWPPRLVPLRDIAECLRPGRPMDWQRLEALTRIWRLRTVVSLATCAMTSYLAVGAPAPLRWTASYRPDRAERATLAVARARLERPSMHVLGTAMALAGTRARARFLRDVLRPSDEYLAGRYTGHRQRWRAIACGGWRASPRRTAP